MKYRLKKLWKRVKLYFSLPHFWVVGIVLLLSVAVFIISICKYICWIDYGISHKFNLCNKDNEFI